MSSAHLSASERSHGRVSRPRPVVGALLLSVAACAGGAEPVDPAVLAREESRLLAPYQQEQSLIANEVEIRMTGNFYSRLAKGVTDTMHSTDVVQRDGNTIYEYRPKLSLAAGPAMRFQLEGTKFFVESLMRVVVLGGAHDFTLRTRAADVSLVRGEDRAQMRGVEIHDGVFTRK